MKAFKNGRKTALMSFFFVLITFAASLSGTELQAQMKMKQPEMVTLKGTVIDLTCASKAKATMDSWANTKNDHMMPGGKIQKSCAVMCLKGGQPAALFSGGKITAAFACNPRATLADFAADSVEVQGFWAGDGKDVKAFVPQKIRAQGSSSWQDVNCATMHQ